MRKCILFIVLIFVSLVHAKHPNGKAMTTIHVVDVKGEPVSGAKVYGSFRYSYTYEDVDRFSEMTSTNGVVIFSGKLGPELNISVYKEGWYKSSKVIHWQTYFSDAEIKDGKWQPWNPTVEIVLKKKKNPIPLLVRNVKLTVPKLGTPYGLDLKKGDWVSPYGAGEVTDIIVKAKGHRSQTEFYDWSFGLNISFPNEHDGIQKFTYPTKGEKIRGSRLKSAHLAPEDGYGSGWSCMKIARGSDTQEQYGIGYYFRTRTKYDESKQQITEAMYSKVYGRIFGGMRHTNNKPPFGGEPYISFTYYVNPTINDQNLEYDTKTNLAIPSGLSPLERRDPLYSVNQP